MWVQFIVINVIRTVQEISRTVMNSRFTCLSLSGCGGGVGGAVSVGYGIPFSDDVSLVVPCITFYYVLFVGRFFIYYFWYYYYFNCYLFYFSNFSSQKSLSWIRLFSYYIMILLCTIILYIILYNILYYLLYLYYYLVILYFYILF